MILIGNQRGGATNLAQHLLKQENEQVEVLQIKGFASDDLQSAFRESYALSRATKCKQHLFSLSLNPPQDAEITPDEFEQTANRAEDALGLSGQPRAIVLHTKNGRSHAHVVWSRIDVDEMRAIQMSYSKNKMQELSRELYREHGWTMPRGFVRHEESDPRNYSLAEWQQCKRSKRDPAKTKEVFQDAWAISDSREAFSSALQSYGFVLAKGDRRGHIAVDHNGEAFAISRYVGVKAKQVRDRLGEPKELPSKHEAHQRAANRIVERLGELREQEKLTTSSKLQKLAERDDWQNKRHASEQAALLERQNQEQQRLHLEHQARLRTGIIGFWDRLTGRRKQTIEQNWIETARADEQAAANRQQLLDAQNKSRSALKRKHDETKQRADNIQQELVMDINRIKEEAQRQLEGPSADRPVRERDRRAKYFQNSSLEP